MSFIMIYMMCLALFVINSLLGTMLQIKHNAPPKIELKDKIKLKDAFDFLDFFNRGVIGPIELYFALEHSGMPLSTEEFSILWDSIAKENFTHIDFSEFLTIALDLKKFEIMEKKRKSIRKSMKKTNDTDLATTLKHSKDVFRKMRVNDIKNEFDNQKQHIAKTYGESNDTLFTRSLEAIYRSTKTSDGTIENSESNGAVKGDAKILGSASENAAQVSSERRRSILGSEGITNFLVNDNLEKIKARQNAGGLFGGRHGANADAEKHHDPPDVPTANAVSNYYFTTTADRYANSPFM